MESSSSAGNPWEESLSIRYLASAVQREGFTPHVLAFNDRSDVPIILARTLEIAPVIIGISVPFQTRARELLELSGRLKTEAGAAPVVAGGHFATFEFQDILRDFPSIDAIVRHEGEATFTDLCHLPNSPRDQVEFGARSPGYRAQWFATYPVASLTEGSEPFRRSTDSPSRTDRGIHIR